MKVTSEKVWPPGFRFHPTDEELVLYYLKRKICKRRIKVDIIAELDVYKWDPEELPGQSLLKSGDRQWFFFSPRDRKYPNASRSNRATRQGYWKATGKDRNITCNSRNVGVKKTLVFYRGRAPNGERTDWVMHEYTLDEEELQRCKNVQDYYALYKVFKKSGPGPKNGEQYGAPFKEEEWVDDDDLDVTITVDSKIPTKHLDVENTVDSKISTEHLDVENTVDSKIPTKQPNGFAAVDNLRSDGQELSPLYDIEDFINQLADEPLPYEPQINYAYDVPQVVGEEEAQSTLVNPSSREVVFSQPMSMCNEEASFDFTQSASLNLQLYEASEVTSVPKNSELVLQMGDGDFLEIDDLIGPEPTPSAVEKPVENLQFDEFSGLSELDLFHDASMFLQDLGTVDQQTIANVLGNDMVNQVEFQSQSVVNQMDHQVQPTLLVHQMDHQLQPNSVVDPMNHLSQSNSVVNQLDYLFQPNSVVSQTDYVLQPHSLGAEPFGNEPWTHDLGAEYSSSELSIHDQLSNIFTPAELNQGFPCTPTSGLVDQSTKRLAEENQNQSGQQGGGATSWISSSLWAFVESIPTTPASASENPLVNRAFERMSSFSRMRITARNTNVTGGEAAAVTRRQSSSTRGFLLLSVFGALCAVLWMLMGTMRVSGRCIFS